MVRLSDGRRKPERKLMVAVVTNTGRPLMPTSTYRARKLLKGGRAVIYKYRPYFTIMLVDRKKGKYRISSTNLIPAPNMSGSVPVQRNRNF